MSTKQKKEVNQRKEFDNGRRCSFLLQYIRDLLLSIEEDLNLEQELKLRQNRANLGFYVGELIDILKTLK